MNGTANLGFGGFVGEDAAGRGLIKTGSGTLALQNAANSYSGSTTILAGRINLDADGTLGNGTGVLNLSGGKLNASAVRDVATPNPINLSADSSITTSSIATNATFEFSSNSIGGTAGTLTLRNEGADGLADQLDVRFSGSGFDFTRPIVIDNGPIGLTRLSSFNTTGNQTFSGVISGNGGYNRSASATGTGAATIFTAANTYTGNTVVNDGTLFVNNASGSGTGTGTVTVNGNGILAGSGSMSGPVTVHNFGDVSPGPTAGSIGNLTTAGGLSLEAGSFLDIDLNTVSGNDVSDKVIVTGGLSTLASVTLDLTNAGAATAGDYTFLDYDSLVTGSLSDFAVETSPPPGFTYAIMQDVPNTSFFVRLTAAALNPGDYNGDLVVDAADFVVWRETLVGGDPGGYDTWRANFGNVYPPGSGAAVSSSSAVPEPAAALLVAIGMMIGGLNGRRWRP